VTNGKRGWVVHLQVHRRHRLFDEVVPVTDGVHGHRVDSSDEFVLRDTGPVARQVGRLAYRRYSVTGRCDHGISWLVAWRSG